MQTKAPVQQAKQNQSPSDRKSPQPVQAQFEDARPEAAAQLRMQSVMADSAQTSQLKSVQAMMAAKPNNTGLPNQLKAGIENLSGMSMDHVRVHYNSDKPAQLQAHAYAQGSEIHVAPGREKHLPHEAWHVVQQAQGRVKPTMQMKGNVPVNDDAGLELEADVMGEKALQFNASAVHVAQTAQRIEHVSSASLCSYSSAMQMKSAFQTFNEVIRSMGTDIGGAVGNILLDLSRLGKLDTENAEQMDFFASAWKGAATDESVSGDDRVMMENLIQQDIYGVGRYLKQSRMESDKGKYLNYKKEEGKEKLYEAFQNALFFRAEREDSSASEKGYLRYDKSKHGKSGSASLMPGRNAEKVKERAEGNLFVSKNRTEAVDYATTAQGGKREVLNIIASRTEVGLMQFDVDSGGYKTPESLTGIFKDAMTESALINLNTWLSTPVTAEDANLVLSKIMPGK